MAKSNPNLLKREIDSVGLSPRDMYGTENHIVIVIVIIY